MAYISVLSILLLTQVILSHTSELSNTIANNMRNSSQPVLNGIKWRMGNRDWRGEVNELTWPLKGWLTGRPTNAIRCKLFCKTGYHLQIHRNGVVSGTLNYKSKYTIFELQSFAPSIIRIKNLATNYYLTIKRNGLFTGDKNADNLHSLFRETHEYNGFNSYASVKFFHKNPYDMYLGIKHNGKMKRAMKSDRVQSATQFLVINV